MKRTPSQPPKRARAKILDASRSNPKKMSAGQGENDSGGDGLACVSGGLDDVVFEDAGLAEGSEDGDGEDRDGDGGGYGEARAEAYVDGDGSEEDAEEAAEDEGSALSSGRDSVAGTKGLKMGFGGVVVAMVVRLPLGWAGCFRLRWSVSAGRIRWQMDRNLGERGAGGEARRRLDRREGRGLDR